MYCDIFLKTEYFSVWTNKLGSLEFRHIYEYDIYDIVILLHKFHTQLQNLDAKL